MPSSYDVAIVGAGPAGSTCAVILSRLGYRVVLLDRARFPRPKTCAEFMSPGVADALRDIGLGTVLDAEGALPVPGMDIVAPNRSVLRMDYQTTGGARCARTLPRMQLDSALVKEASRNGAELWEGFIARSPIIDAGTVMGVRGSSDGKAREVRASLTIVADGARSAMASSIGLARSARWPVRLGLVAHFGEHAPLNSGHGQMHVGEGGYCGVAPLPGNRLNVALVVRYDSLRRANVSATEYFERWIATHPRLRDLLAGCRRETSVRGVSPIGARVSRPWTRGALLIGDAAGFFDPFTGEGIYRAITGARLAAEVVDRALSAGDVSASRLATYERMRRRAFTKKSSVTALVQLFVQYPRLLEYAAPRLSERRHARDTLALVLGDVLDAREFLRVRVLWDGLRP